MSKPIWKSKRFLGAVATVLVLGYNILGVGQFGLPEIPEWVYAALAAVGITVGGYEAKKRSDVKKGA